MRKLAVAFVTICAGCMIGDPFDSNENTSGVRQDAVLLQWNDIAVQTVGATPPFPSTRAMAAVQLAVFEGVNAITHRYRPYFGTVTAAKGASIDAAIVVAAHDTLVFLFPAAQTSLDAQRDTSLAAITDGASKDNGKAAGAAAAAAVIAFRTGDGAAPPQFFTPPNTDPYEWAQTPSCAASNNQGVFFHWQFVKPFGVQSSSQFRAPAPPSLTSFTYTNSFNEVKAVGGLNSPYRPQDRSDVAKFYAAQPPHRGWNQVARQLVLERNDEVTRTARILALLNMSLSDAHITVFESKYFYQTWRPETGIARASEDGNPNTSPGEYAGGGITPFITTPCFPSYPSAHGSGAGVGKQVLGHFYGCRFHNLTVTDPGAPTITLHYTDLRQITRDVSDARVFGGIHWRYDQVEGEDMGEDIGDWNINTLLRPQFFSSSSTGDFSFDDC